MADRTACSQRTLFLHLYARFLAREKHRLEKRAAPAGLAAWAQVDDYLTSIREIIEALGDAADGFMLYLLGLVLKELREEAPARAALAAAVTAYPCNWAAWAELQGLCASWDDVAGLDLPSAHFAAPFFRAGVRHDLQDSAAALGELEAAAPGFPDSDVLLRGVALAYNSVQRYDEAQAAFDALLRRDPHRLDAMDVYSNIVYVKEDAPALATLARRCSETDPYRPETCCVVGNYYSLRGQHEKAVVYFRRALKLDPGYIPAWTLMGHEFVELKNPAAAIESYQRAVALAPRDYRAWYGLGQTYELVNMPHYALHYYERAAVLRGSDPRMWNAIAQCFASPAVGNVAAAIACYERALPGDREGVAVAALAKLHAERGDAAAAARYYRMNLDRIDKEGLTGHADALVALKFLAEYAKAGGDLGAAQSYYERLLDYGPATQQEDAKASLRAIQEEAAATRIAAAAGGGAPTMMSPGSDMGITPPPR